ncbi:peptidase inhibitor family I36 protein [Nocardioides sp. CCNWLW239]|uniref:peptidase inhibitor family I36 protein n=1 Tax=Nocardioides sp. CCNWLW239 TaxID=3128902 RepID=UPI003FA60379
MSRRSSHRLAGLIVAFLAALSTSLIAISPASAAVARNGHCEVGEFCLYYSNNQGGSVSDFAGSVSDYGTSQPTCYEFKGSGTGQGLCVKNRAASVWNRTGRSVRVHYNSGYGGAYQTIAAGASPDLNSTLYKQNASHRYL